MTTVHCVECDGAVALNGELMLGELVACPECGVELEVVSLDPLAIELAPEIEEDWGE